MRVFLSVIAAQAAIHKDLDSGLRRSDARVRGLR